MRDILALAVTIGVIALGLGIVLGFIIGLYAKD